MALIYEGMTCKICGELLDVAGPYVATSHFIVDERDPLWRFSDAAMHYDCFQKWEDREAFVAKYNETMGTMVWRDGTRDHINPDGTVVSVKASGIIPTPKGRPRSAEELARAAAADAKITERKCPHCGQPCPSYRKTCKHCRQPVNAA